VPLVAFMTWLYRRSDEFERHLMLLQCSVAFVITVLLDALVDQLQLARFVSPYETVPRWWLAIAAWAMSVLIVGIRNRPR
jgi:hypothetical protein